jgi:hypothetical protein
MAIAKIRLSERTTFHIVHILIYPLHKQLTLKYNIKQVPYIPTRQKCFPRVVEITQQQSRSTV